MVSQSDIIVKRYYKRMSLYTTGRAIHSRKSTVLGESAMRSAGLTATNRSSMECKSAGLEYGRLVGIIIVLPLCAPHLVIHHMRLLHLQVLQDY